VRSAPTSTSCACYQIVLFPGKDSFGIWLLMWCGERVGILRAFRLGLGVEGSAGVAYSCLGLERTLVSPYYVLGEKLWGLQQKKRTEQQRKVLALLTSEEQCHV
jgi:hypothetical protein